MARLFAAAAALISVLCACANRTGQDRYVGEGTATVDPRGRPEEQRTKTDPAEEVGLRRLEDGRFELHLDDCALTTAAAVGGAADIPSGTRCRAQRLSAEAEIVVRSGTATLDDAAGTLSLELVGDGTSSRLGESVSVAYRYAFRGSKR